MDYNQTVLDPVALLFTTIMCIVIMTARREYIIIPFILVACFITSNQRLSILTMDFPMLRIITLLGLFRIFLRGEYNSLSYNVIDKLFVYYMVIKFFTYTILWASFSGLVFMLGQSMDILGVYFFARFTITNFQAYDTTIKTIILVSIPIAAFMIYEHQTGGRNLFSVFGGVTEWSEVRRGKLRAQGAFDHSIMAGTFGAMLLPLCWGIWHRNKKILAAVGIICSLIITLASSSSGPIVSFGAGLFGIAFWKFNKYTRTVRKAFFLTLIVLHLAMKAPVWYLIARIDIVGGSTGHHRSMLIDAAIRNFFSWFAIGIKNTGVWGLGLDDVTNQYILEGARGGFIPMVLFIAIMVKCFKTIGKVRTEQGENLKLQKYIWSLGVLLFLHTVTFFSISYFGQMVFFYYVLIAMISGLNNLPVSSGTNATPGSGAGATGIPAHSGAL